jgi:hypothetical protein
MNMEKSGFVSPGGPTESKVASAEDCIRIPDANPWGPLASTTTTTTKTSLDAIPCFVPFSMFDVMFTGIVDTTLPIPGKLL